MPTIPNIFVKDSYHTELIATNLQNIYGDKANVFTVVPQDEKIDIFFLSAKNILYHDIEVSTYKELYGSDKATVVAVSTMKCFLEDVMEKKYLQVDFAISKDAVSGRTSNKALPQSAPVLFDILSSVTGQEHS